MNQSEIAKAIGVSRPLVSVLLAEARECGIVTITINSVESARELLARRLEARFGLAPRRGGRGREKRRGHQQPRRRPRI